MLVYKIPLMDLKDLIRYILFLNIRRRKSIIYIYYVFIIVYLLTIVKKKKNA